MKAASKPVKTPFGSQFDIRYSQRYARLLAVLYALAFLFIVLGPISWLVKPVLLTLLLYFAWRSYRDIQRSRDVEGLSISDDKTYLVLKSNLPSPAPDPVEVSLHHSSVVTSFIQVLRFRAVNDGRLPTIYAFVLLADSGSPDTLRRLRVWLRTR